MPDSDDRKSLNGGMIHISEDVIAELARKTIQGIPNIKTAGLASKFSIGRRSGGIRVSVEHNQGSVSVDAYVLVKYGQRIPDLAWDVQEKIKDNLERYTGYDVKAVNVNVQGIYTSAGDNIGIDIETEKNPSPDEEAD
ncbi:MAG: Asp23/Gls24 family envelope stress response protein [Synergistaceae bacterium]|nr:Asp23/Gls24 family envelope stress response protein [Synergistaceae bacterium]